VTPPVGHLPLERVTDQPAALPVREVAVLNRQLGQVGPGRVAARRVQRQQFPYEQADRPVGGDDVVHADGELVLGVAQPDQQAAEQVTAGEVELGRRVEVRQPASGLDPIVLPGQRGHVLDGEPPGFVRVVHDLNRTALHGREPRPQGLLASHDRANAGLEGGHVERTGHVPPAVEVVRGPRQQLVLQPEPLLFE
jgi:hypothetical protein